MNRKNKIIILLLLLGIILFTIIRFVIIPHNEKKHAEYELKQADSLTHDFDNITKYKNAYMGNNSNTANLFYNLPLNYLIEDFKIDSTNCVLTVNYSKRATEIEADKLQRDLVYNSAAAFALIDNLSAVNYNFTDSKYIFTRTQFENILGSPLSTLSNSETWHEKVTDNLKNQDFIRKFY